MQRRVGLWISSLLIFASPAFAKDYIVKYKNGGGEKSVRSAYRVLDTHDKARLLKISISEKSKEAEAARLARLMRDPNVEYVVENFRLHRFDAPPSAEALREQWALAKVNAERAWQLTGNKGSRNIKVAVIDTGIDYNHESLKSNMIKGYNFRDNNDDPMDKTSDKNPGHGTHCAGIIGSTGKVENGTSGMAQDVSLMPVRFLGEDGSGDLMGGIKSIDYSIEQGAQVISASWGATVPRSQATPLIEAVERADKAGVIFVAAAANDGRNNDQTDVFPANAGFPNTITVAASGPQDEKPQWSNYGAKSVHLASPGLKIMSTLPQQKYGELSGTSMATPLVSGLVAFLKAQDASLTGADVRALLQTTGAKVSIETACNCRIDAAAATEALLNKAPYVVPAAATIAPGESFVMKMKNAEGAVKFASSNTGVATVDVGGAVTAVATGDTTITATDAKGQTATSLTISVKEASDGGGGGGGGECPLPDPQLCEMMCLFDPTLPWCQGN
jgi:thermitase